MAKQWKCARCGTANDEGTLTCSNCRMIRGAVVVPTNQTTSSSWPANDIAPSNSSEGWSATPPTDPPVGPPSDASTDTAPAPAATNGWVTPQASDAAKPVPIWRRAVSWVFLAFIGAGIVAGALFSASRGSSGEIDRAGDLTASDLRVGDCFDFKDPDEEVIQDVTARPCAQEHEFEVVFIGSLPGDTYPTIEAVRAWAYDNCVSGFNLYVGRDFNSSVLDLTWLYPDEEAWRADDHSVQCAASHPDKPRLTGSFKGSKL